MLSIRSIVLLVFALCLPLTAGAQIYHTEFAGGAGDAPEGWTLTGTGKWEAEGHAGRAISVTGTGDDLSYWRADAPNLRPESLYRVKLWAKLMAGTPSASVLCGLDTNNHNFTATTEWQPYTFVFSTPAATAKAFLRFGQFHLKGTVSISDVTLSPVQPIYARAGDVTLGAGERVWNGTYSFDAPFTAEGTDSSHPLVSHTAPFNSDRWVFLGDREVIYRHEAPGAMQTAGSVRVDLGLYAAGDCVVSASRDGKTWVDIDKLHSRGAVTMPIPASLLPAARIFVRLQGSAANPAAGVQDPGAFMVDGYQYTAALSKAPRDMVGATRFLDVTRDGGALAAKVEALGDPGHQAQSEARLTVPAGAAGDIAEITLTQTGRQPITASVAVPAGGGMVSLPYVCSWTGAIHTAVSILPNGGAPVFVAETDDYVPRYFAADYGYALPAIAEGQLWWCEGDYKVSRGRRAPQPVLLKGTAPPVAGPRIMLARSERQAFQLVLSAGAESSPLKVSVTDLAGASGALIPASAVTIRQVAYVPVSVQSDGIGSSGDWPDPLPPLSGDWSPTPGVNNPLWITVTAPADCKTGDYAGSIVIAGKKTIKIPLRVHIWNFGLPATTALRSGMGISPATIKRYHNLSTDAEMAQVWDLYMKDFAAHRLAPFNPAVLANIHFDVTPGDHPTVKLDFTDFDKSAHKYLDGQAFNAFAVPYPGLGSGRYPNYIPGEIAGYGTGTPAYDALMTQYGQELSEHLEKNGWLSKAYVFWYDQPQTADYPFVVGELAKLKKYAPKIKRLLTAGADPALIGNVNIWCPITSAYSVEGQSARKTAGDESWWFIGTEPRQPYPGIFIDHPAIDMRMWLWQTWKYQVDGIMLWETTWWTSPAQFAADNVQNPWTDPMSYAPTENAALGNGDGRLFYPPNRAPGADQRPDLSGPVDSIRWEELGEGVEDWEYLHLLDQLTVKRAAAGDTSDTLTRARELLTIPDNICKDMTHYTDDPAALYHYRVRLAHAIEGLLAPPAAKR